jgi:type IV pilus assembly protein PilQ
MKTNQPAFRIGCLILVGAVSSVAPTLGQTPVSVQAPVAASVISSVAITQAEQRASVRVEGEGSLEVHATRMQNPDRLVLDFAGARLAVRKTSIPGVSAPVRGVRLAQYRPDVTRVVVDLTAAAPYQISRDGAAVVVLFASQPESGESAEAAKMAAADKSASHYDLSAPRQIVKHSDSVALQSPRFALPSELAQPSVVLASFGEKSPEKPADQSAQQQAVQQAGGAAATVAIGQNPAAVPPKYSGEPVSVNLKDVDLRDFFRLIHEISGLNVVLDPAVKGNLTIVLDEVPWDQALDIVLQNHGLDKQLNGNVLRIATHETLRKEAEARRDLEKAQAEATNTVTITRVLSYGNAKSLVPTLKKFLSPRGDILSDDRTNQLIIRDIPSVIPTVDDLIHRLDRKAQQVQIEARVVSASRSFSQDIGTEFGFAGTTTSGRSLFSGNQAVGGSGVTTTGIPAPPVTVSSTGSTSGNGVTSGLPLTTNFAASAPTSGLGYSFRSPNFAVDFFISAAEAKGVGKLLSKPTIYTQDNQKGMVKQGAQVPIQTTINNTISVQYIDAVLKLEVTPQITKEGTIYMDVHVENTQIDNGIPRIQGVPALDTEAVETKVTVADGTTIVIGGVMVNQQQVNIQETPILGSLPVIGNLFKRTTTSVSSSELIFFLTPRIIPSA